MSAGVVREGADVARDVLRARHVPRAYFIFAGAGASADSIRPFRAPGALGTRWSAGVLGGAGVLIAGTGTAWLYWPRIARFFFERFFMNSVDAAVPNACHRFASEEDVPCITTNVDHLFHRAGAMRVAAVHGSVYHEMCSACGGEPPCCAPPRPAVLFFNDRVPNRFVGDEWQKHAHLMEVAEQDVPCFVFVVGVSWSIPTMAGGVRSLRERGAQIVHVNLVPPPPRYADDRDWVVLEGAEMFFARLLREE